MVNALREPPVPQQIPNFMPIDPSCKKESPRPDLILLVGLDFLSFDRKQCPQHLSECHKQLYKIMFPPKGKY